MFDELQSRILRRFVPPTSRGVSNDEPSRLRFAFDDTIIDRLRGKIVADFGCGYGAECDELASIAARVIGVDTNARVLEAARVRNARHANVTFTDVLREPVDAIISIDAFEHFGDPAAILGIMSGSLAPGGIIATGFGPTWLHPMGGHLFSVFPWSHLIFSEKALCRWRAQHRDDGAQRFGDVEGGLNQMTIRRFERLCAASGLKLEHFELVPIRKTGWAHTAMTREYLTALVRAVMVKEA